MHILVLRVIPAMTGIRPKHISHLGFVGDLTGPHGVRAYRVLREIRAPAVGAREPPALAVAGGRIAVAQAIQRARSWPRNRLEPGECRLTQFDAAIALGRGAGLIHRRRSGLSRLIPIILERCMTSLRPARDICGVTHTAAARGDDYWILSDEAVHDPIPGLFDAVGVLVLHLP